MVIKDLTNLLLFSNINLKYPRELILLIKQIFLQVIDLSFDRIAISFFCHI
jgi:hypothetical protein